MDNVKTPYIIQQGRVLARRPEKDYETTGASDSITITSVAANLTCSLNTTAPFIGVVDGSGILWQLPNRCVQYDVSSVTLNLSEIYETKRMISVPAKITIGLQGGGTMQFSRYKESDSARGFAWRNGTAAIFTDTLVPVAGTTFYTDPQMSISGGTTTAYATPTASAYPGGWKALFSVVPKQIAYEVIKTGTYGENR